MSQITPDVSEGAQSSVMGLTLVQLKAVSRPEGLQVSGAKATLQGRIKDRLSEYVRKNDVARFHRLKAHIEKPEHPAPPLVTHFSTSMAISNQGPPASSHSGNQTMSYSHSQPPVRLQFKPSPFYNFIQSITPIQECKIRETTRDSFECRIKLAQSVIDRFSHPAAGENLRLMIYCAAEPISSFSTLEIAFPQSVEIKVNGNEVKANLRGLKNRPGSTRPADITDLVHKRLNYNNVLTVTYALTTKRFYLVVNLVNKISPESLVTQVRDRSRIPKETVLREMAAKGLDAEIQTTSTIMSLKCPLSTLRMEVPCRGTMCSHNQCYDALSFLQLQEQAPTWVCPICNKPATFASINVDGYVNDILETSSRNVDQVSIEPDGSWKPVSTDLGHGKASSSDEDGEDDDLIEIQEPPKPGSYRVNNPWPAYPLTRTPPASSREQSITSASARSSSSKRPASAVVDLTLSSDDEEPSRPAKRQSLHQPTLSMPTRSVPTPQHGYSGQLTPSESMAYQSGFNQFQQQVNGAYRSDRVSFSIPRGDDYSHTHLSPLDR